MVVGEGVPVQWGPCWTTLNVSGWGPFWWGQIHHGEWSHGSPLCGQTDRQIRMKTLPWPLHWRTAEILEPRRAKKKLKNAKCSHFWLIRTAVTEMIMKLLWDTVQETQIINLIKSPFGCRYLVGVQPAGGDSSLFVLHWNKTRLIDYLSIYSIPCFLLLSLSFS